MESVVPIANHDPCHANHSFRVSHTLRLQSMLAPLVCSSGTHAVILVALSLGGLCGYNVSIGCSLGDWMRERGRQGKLTDLRLLQTALL
jgi:hypothetical protein